MNMLLNSMKQASNFTHTENGAITHKTTESKLLDMFAMGGSMRNRSVGDVTLMFKNAYEENPVYALKCLFYLRDITQGQGERRFFRECIRWLAINHTEAARRNFKVIPDFGRWDDLYSFIGTPLEKEVFEFIKQIGKTNKESQISLIESYKLIFEKRYNSAEFDKIKKGSIASKISVAIGIVICILII